MAQADVDKKLEEKFKAANQKLEEIQKVFGVRRVYLYCMLYIMCVKNATHAVENANFAIRLVFRNNFDRAYTPHLNTLLLR